MRHVAILPARNEADRIRACLLSLVNQTVPPDRIYVVDDGSTDSTPERVEEVARAHPRVHLIRRDDRGHRQMGSGVVDAFNAAYRRCRHEPFTYVSKLDADLEFPPDYFEVLLGFLDAHPEVGAAGGVPCDRIGDRFVPWRMPPSHVPGPLKTIRRSVFDRMGGFRSTLGWDIIDLVQIRALGYATCHLDHLRVLHHRQHGSAEGVLRGRVQWGEGAYRIGSHPLFVTGRGLYRMLEPPYLLGGAAFLWGYLRAALRRAPQLDDRELRQRLRREQLHRLLHRNRLPDDLVPSRHNGHRPG